MQYLKHGQEVQVANEVKDAEFEGNAVWEWDILAQFSMLIGMDDLRWHILHSCFAWFILIIIDLYLS